VDGIEGKLTVEGGGGKNTLVVDDSATQDNYPPRPATGPYTYTVTDQGLSRKGSAGVATVAYSGLEGITLLGSNDANTFDIQSTSKGAPVTIRAGTGDDTFRVGYPWFGHAILDGIQAKLTVDGGGGTDTMTVDDSAPPDAYPPRPATGPYTYHVSDHGLSRVGSAGVATVACSGLEGITLLGSDDANTFDITGTAKGTPVTIRAGTGDDTFRVGYPWTSGAILDGIRGKLTIDGGGGTDSMTVDDSGTPDAYPPRPATGPYTYRVSEDGLSRTGSAGVATVAYSGLEGITLLGSNDANTFDITGTAKGTPVTIEAGSGDDTFRVG
jgi:hypothetical protein